MFTFTVTAFGSGKTVKLVTKNSTSNTYGVAKNNRFYYYGESNSSNHIMIAFKVENVSFSIAEKFASIEGKGRSFYQNICLIRVNQN